MLVHLSDGEACSAIEVLTFTSLAWSEGQLLLVHSSYTHFHLQSSLARSTTRSLMPG